jgi:hypothetical protein
LSAICMVSPSLMQRCTGSGVLVVKIPGNRISPAVATQRGRKRHQSCNSQSGKIGHRRGTPRKQIRWPGREKRRRAGVSVGMTSEKTPFSFFREQKRTKRSARNSLVYSEGCEVESFSKRNRVVLKAESGCAQYRVSLLGLQGNPYDWTDRCNSSRGVFVAVR